MTVSGVARWPLFGWAVTGIMSMLAVLVFCGVARAGEPANSLYRFAPPPQWTNRVSAEYEAPLPADGVSDGTWDLLLDRQINVSPDGDDYYQHSSVKLVNSSGVDQRSQIDIHIDPTYQTLSLNSIRVLRQGRVIDQRAVARITALPEETELSDRIYNGAYNINILLFDVRVGDVIDYEYTIHSRQRLFPGQFSDRMVTAWAVPVRWERLRLLAPASLALSYKVDDHSVPTSSIHASVRELKWEWRDLAAIQADDHRPSWYSPWPYLEVTTSKDWAEVARRVAPLFQVSHPRSPAVLAVVKAIREGGGTPAEQALRALQFVQEQIRYVSISIGVGAFRPAQPDQVLQRRFGDCKDKSLLLVTILRQLGIDAQPALVNTRRGRVLDSRLPMPYSFDHAIVRMRLDNNTYWLDGTREKQLSPVTANAIGDFGKALVLDTATTGLAEIPRPSPGARSKRSEVLIDLRAGVSKPARLQIDTFYQGTWADSVRHNLADQSSAERQSSYLKYIASYYPKARVSAPVTIHDDQVNNIVEVREYYDIDHPFKTNDRGRLELLLQADEIYHYLDPDVLKGGARKAPFATDYPARVQQTLRALLPWALDIKDETVKIENPAFRYQDVVRYSKEGGVPQLTVTYRYEALQDSVDAAAVAKYAEDRGRAYDDSGYYIRPGTGPRTVTEIVATAQPWWPLAATPLWVVLASFAVAMFIAARVIFRWNPLARKSEASWPVGIRGWLAIPATMVFLAPWAFSLSLRDLAGDLEVNHWPHFNDAIPEPWKSWAPAVMLVFAAWGVCLLVAETFLIYLFFRRRSSAPYVFIVSHWVEALYSAALLLFRIATHVLIQPNTAVLVGTLTGIALLPTIYTAYFLLSKRVKATFTVRLRDRQTDVAAAPALT